VIWDISKILRYSEKIEKLENLLSTGLPKNEFRNAKIDLEYHQQHIEIIRKKMLPHSIL
jgi:hypothetical protein